MSIYQRILGHPFVYKKIRPLVVGIDMGPVYRQLQVAAADVIVDVGCGTGDALNYLTDFRAYHGFDTDEVAIAAARQRAQGRANVTFTTGLLGAADLARIPPPRPAVYGLLHHLTDDEAVGPVKMCGATARIGPLVTQPV